MYKAVQEHLRRGMAIGLFVYVVIRLFSPCQIKQLNRVVCCIRIRHIPRRRFSWPDWALDAQRWHRQDGPWHDCQVPSAGPADNTRGVELLQRPSVGSIAGASARNAPLCLIRDICRLGFVEMSMCNSATQSASMQIWSAGIICHRLPVSSTRGEIDQTLPMLCVLCSGTRRIPNQLAQP